MSTGVNEKNFGFQRKFLFVLQKMKEKQEGEEMFPLQLRT